MIKSEQCESCQMNAHSHYLVCAIHPMGPCSNRCPDYAPKPGYVVEQWQPIGAAYYDGELVITRRYRTPESRIELLENHPLFTGQCPRCHAVFENTDTPRIHWDCLVCGWIDNSI